MNGSNSVQLLPFNTLYQKLNIPFADYGSMQYFAEKVKYRIIEKQTMQHHEDFFFSLKYYCLLTLTKKRQYN